MSSYVDGNLMSGETINSASIIIRGASKLSTLQPASKVFTLQPAEVAAG